MRLGLLMRCSLFLFLLAFTGFETNNKYKIQNSLGQQVYFAAEGKTCLFDFLVL